jgi:hypothetical protein
MKKLTVIIALLLASAAALCTAETANAQTKGFTYGIWEQTQINLNSKIDYTSFGFVVAPGYAFNSTVSMRAQLESIIGLWSDPGLGAWSNNRGRFSTNMTLGPSVAVNLVKDNSAWGIVSGVATVGHSLFVRDWSYIYYDLGFEWSMGHPYDNPASKKLYRFMAGVGVRYNDAWRPDTRDYLNFYLKIGFRFN